MAGFADFFNMAQNIVNKAMEENDGKLDMSKIISQSMEQVDFDALAEEAIAEEGAELTEEQKKEAIRYAKESVANANLAKEAGEESGKKLSFGQRLVAKKMEKELKKELREEGGEEK